jgi:hypothetical protein
MGEKFPSKKFRQVMAKFLGTDDPIVNPSTDIRSLTNIAGDMVVEAPILEETLGDVKKLGPAPPGFRRVAINPIPYQDMLNDYQRRVDMTEIKLKNSIPVWSPSYDEALEENKALKANCEALEEREQIIISAIIECFGRRPMIVDDTIQVSGESYNEMVRTINKFRITE